MGRVDAFSIAGLDLWFSSSDHLPPHFHARRAGEWEIRVFFLLCTDRHLEVSVKWRDRNRSIGRKHLEALREAAVQFREEIMEEWEVKVDSRELDDEG
ncbi:MAG: DUF4160 domain-containing protein [Acidobacteria bacterium]|nr:DUF4160 domain-containing protein [Acidobacteriota bacterium]